MEPGTLPQSKGEDWYSEAERIPTSTLTLKESAYRGGTLAEGD